MGHNSFCIHHSFSQVLCLFVICGPFAAVNKFGATKLYPLFLENLGFWRYRALMGLEVILGFVSIPGAAWSSQNDQHKE